MPREYNKRQKCSILKVSCYRLATEKESSSLAEIFSVFYKAELKWSNKKIENNMLSNKKEYYLAFEKDILIGALSLRFHDGSCELDALSVKIKGRGFGSKLLRFAEKIVKKKNCKKIWCYSLDFYNAGDFYKKNGWSEIRHISNFFDGKNCFVYEKII